jgi:hypothetical protein
MQVGGHQELGPNVHYCKGYSLGCLLGFVPLVEMQEQKTVKAALA